MVCADLQCVRQATKQFKWWLVLAVMGSIVFVGALTRALLQSMCDSKATQMNVQYSRIWELMIYKLEVGHKTADETKNIFMWKVKGQLCIVWLPNVSRNVTLVANTLTCRFWGCALNHKSKYIEKPSESIRWAWFITFMILAKASSTFVPHVTKIWQNFWLTLLIRGVICLLK